MRPTLIIRLFSLFLFLNFSLIDSQAQSANNYVIQIATYDSFEQFAKDKDKFSYSSAIEVEKVGKRVKVYLLRYNGEWDEGVYFSPGETLDLQYSFAKERHPGAFRRNDVDIEKTTNAWDIFEKYKYNQLPTEYTTKGGGSFETNNSSDTEHYKIQLGAFTEQKSNAYIADNYGLSSAEKTNADELLSHDFTTVNKKVCRRYYFGEYQNKADALAKKKQLEKATNRRLILVKK